jgi:hypothetical protein
MKLTSPFNLKKAFACVLKELGESQESVDTLYYNLQVRCESTELMSGVAHKAEPSLSVANREMREQANLAKKAEKRARRAAYIAANPQESLNEASSSSSMDGTSTANKSS